MTLKRTLEAQVEVTEDSAPSEAATARPCLQVPEKARGTPSLCSASPPDLHLD